VFEHPAYLVLLLLIPLLGWRMWRSSRTRAVPFSSAIVGLQVSPTWRMRLCWLPAAMTLLALTLMVIAMARPREGREQTMIHSEGIAIEIVVDRSSSMTAMDFKIDGESVDRLTAIKHVADRFVRGDEAQSGGVQSGGVQSGGVRRFSLGEGESTLAGRASDLVGLISFAGYADSLTPPTLDHLFWAAQLETITIASDRQEDGTAIGDAISLAVEKLNSLDDRGQEAIKGKVIILLTDGENTAGEIEPIQAAELAKTLGIKVYTIGVGTKGLAPVPVRSPFSGRQRMQMMQVTIDEATLKEIAVITDGRYFRATDTDSLEAIYREIDQLEKTKVEIEHMVDYREIAVQGINWAGYPVPPLLLVAILVLAARMMLSITLFRQFDS